MPGTRQRTLAALVIGTLPLTSHALPEVVPLPPIAGPDLIRQLVVLPGGFVELCTGLRRGRALTWTFAADGPLDFNTHFHVADEVKYPERMTAMRGAHGTFVPSSDQLFCWMWSNPTPAALNIRVQLGP